MGLKKLARSILPAQVWRYLMHGRRWVSDFPQSWENWKKESPILGMRAAASIHLGGMTPNARRQGSLQRVWLKGYRFPFYYRQSTSDIEVLYQVFANKEYGTITNDRDIRFIIDCGANIGCTSFYFLHRYPRAKVIAVEPDPGNYELCRLNLEPFGHRAIVLQSAIWSSHAPLRVLRGLYRDGREWAFQVGPSGVGESEVVGVTIDDLLARSQAGAIDILKMDIEEAEVEVFRTGCENWLRFTRYIAIELHNSECERVFYNALRHIDYIKHRSGELTICKLLSNKSG